MWPKNVNLHSLHQILILHQPLYKYIHLLGGSLCCDPHGTLISKAGQHTTQRHVSLVDYFQDVSFFY